MNCSPILRRLIAAAIVAGAAPTGVLAWPGHAHAASDAGTNHYVAQQTDYFPRPGDDPSTFYGIFSLDGVCGFAHATYSQSDTETFFIAQHQNATTSYKYNAVGKIDDEPWTITPVAADGQAGDTFTGSADEVATSRGYDGGAMPSSINYTFDGTATDINGHHIHHIVKGTLRADAGGNVTR